MTTVLPTRSVAKAMLDEGVRWTDRITRLAFPVVLWCAKFGHTISYGQLAEELERRHGEKQKGRKTLYGRPAGKMGDILEQLSSEWGRTIPPVNALIVNADTHLPGSGVNSYLEHFLNVVAKQRPFNKRNRDAVASQVIEDVHHFTEWDQVARQLGISQLPVVTVLTDAEVQPIVLPDPVQIHGGGGESEAHRRLKEWAAAHPEAFGEFGRFRKGKTEVLLQSHDEVDVLFANADTILAVEVKAINAPDSELWRGVFQCVKYRAVLRATQYAKGEHPTAQAVLLVERNLPEELVRLAKRLKVRWFLSRSLAAR